MVNQTSWFALITSYDNNVIQAETNLICLWVHGQGKLNDQFRNKYSITTIFIPFYIRILQFCVFYVQYREPMYNFKDMLSKVDIQNSCSDWSDRRKSA